MASINTLVARMVYWCRDANLGYSQADRWNIRNGGNCDCSSLVIHCLREAGFDTGTASYTGNMWQQLSTRGWRRLPANGSPRYGDILLNDTHHVAVYIGGGRLAQASSSEYGTAYGRGGDQTGRETNIKAYYSYPWNCYLRYVGAQNGGSDMATAAEVWGYNWKKTAPGGNMYNCVTNMYKDLAKVKAAVGRLDQLKCTHVVFQTANAIGIWNVLAGTYHIFSNPQEYKDHMYALRTSGARITTWAALRGRKGSDANKVANPSAFGVKI